MMREVVALEMYASRLWLAFPRLLKGELKFSDVVTSLVDFANAFKWLVNGCKKGACSGWRICVMEDCRDRRAQKVGQASVFQTVGCWKVLKGTRSQCRGEATGRWI